MTGPTDREYTIVVIIIIIIIIELNYYIVSFH